MLTARLHYAVKRFRNSSYCSVNGCGTVLKRTVPGGMVLTQVGGPNQFRTVPFASEYNTAGKRPFAPLVLAKQSSRRAQ